MRPCKGRSDARTEWVADFRRNRWPDCVGISGRLPSDYAIWNGRALLRWRPRGGQEGLRLVRELRPAALTLDIMMPDLDGWTVLAAIKGDPELAGIPVVLMSIVDQKNRGYALGAADYLVKPVDRSKLIETLRSICGSTAGHVLLVDDDEVVRSSVRQALEPIGWKVTEAENGQVAVDALVSAKPDVIILDLMMPEMDGFEFMHELRRRPAWQDIPVVVITAQELTQEDRDRLNGGVERIIGKSDRGSLC